MERENTVFIPQTTYIYRVVHRVMEGDCQCEHGPMPVTVGPLYADVYPVTNAQYYQFVQDSGYRPEDDRGYLCLLYTSPPLRHGRRAGSH